MNINYSAGIFCRSTRPFLIEIQAVPMRRFYDSCLFALLFALFVRFCVCSALVLFQIVFPTICIKVRSEPCSVHTELSFNICIHSIGGFWPNCSSISIWRIMTANLDEPWAFFGNSFCTCNIIRFINNHLKFIQSAEQSNKISIN